MRKIVEAAPSCGIGTLTLYAFSADNWRRPTAEVATLIGNAVASINSIDACSTIPAANGPSASIARRA